MGGQALGPVPTVSGAGFLSLPAGPPEGGTEMGPQCQSASPPGRPVRFVHRCELCGADSGVVCVLVLSCVMTARCTPSVCHLVTSGCLAASARQGDRCLARGHTVFLESSPETAVSVSRRVMRGASWREGLRTQLLLDHSRRCRGLMWPGLSVRGLVLRSCGFGWVSCSWSCASGP